MVWGDGFEIESVISCRVAGAGLRVVEVPSFERRRVFGESNLRAVRDGTRVLLTILAERRTLRRKRTDPAWRASVTAVKSKASSNAGSHDSC
jgi:hypothetical protein